MNNYSNLIDLNNSDQVIPGEDSSPEPNPQQFPIKPSSQNHIKKSEIEQQFLQADNQVVFASNNNNNKENIS